MHFGNVCVKILGYKSISTFGGLKFFLYFCKNFGVRTIFVHLIFNFIHHE